MATSHLYKLDIGANTIYIKSIDEQSVHGYVFQDGIKFLEIPKQHLPLDEDMYGEISKILN
jgi:hypothetical protein